MPSNTAPGFAIGGKAVTDFGSFEQGRSIVLQPDGRFLVAGSTALTGDFDAALARYNADGTLDTTFGSAGTVVTHVGLFDTIEGMALQADGKILLVGSNATSGPPDLLVLRYNPDGTLDATFGTGGFVTLDFNAGFDQGRAILVQPDGKIVIGGNTDSGLFFADFALVRLNADGTLDATFNGGGTVVTPAAPGFSNDVVYGVTLQSDGKILAAGASAEFGSDHFTVARYNADGSLDTTFGGDGIVITPLSDFGTDRAHAVVVQTDGKIIAAGMMQLPFDFMTHFALARYNADGTLDTSFGAGGIVTTALDFNPAVAHSVLVQSDGRIIAAGYTEFGGFAIARYNSDGSLDTSFAGDGTVTIDAFGAERAYSLALQPDGRILLAGESGLTGSGDFAVMRFNADGSLDAGFGDRVNTLDGVSSYTLGGPAAVLDPDVRVFDDELAAQGHYGGASVTLARQGGADAMDVFSATGLLGALSEGTALVYDGIGVGTVSTNSGGTLVLTFNDSATQAVVDGVLQSIAYANSGSPPSGPIVIEWLFSDGNGGAQGDGGALAAIGSTIVGLINPLVLWSTLADGSAMPFDPFAHLLRFDDTSISAAEVRIARVEFGNTLVSAGGKSVTFLIAEGQMTSGNVVFDDGSLLLVGDNDPFTGDDPLDDTLIGGAGNDHLRGLAGNDTLTGGDGNDYLDGGLGVDTMTGGDGDDTYVVGQKAAVNPVTSLAAFGEPGAYVLQGPHLFTPDMGTFTVFIGDGTGDGLADSMVINYVDAVDNWSLWIATYGLGTNFEIGHYADAIRQSDPGFPNLDFNGNGQGANLVFGNFTINDIAVDYSAGVPVLVTLSLDFEHHGEAPDAPGLFGTLLYNSSNTFVPESVVEAANEGIDTVRASIDYALPDNVENLVMLPGATRGTGNVLVNAITGNDFDNEIDGGAGADAMAGGGGNDTYFVDHAGDSVTENAGEGTDTVRSSVAYTLGANLENLTLTGGAAIDGTGNGRDNVITGNSAANVLKGKGGNDTYVIDALDTVVETAGQGTDLVQAGFSYTLGAHLENLTLLGMGDVNGTGNGLANVITGNSGSNTLDGRGGGDTMRGGAGNDTYVVDNAADSVVELLMEGTDLVRSSVSYTLGDNVENLTLTGSAAVNGAGNALDNALTGNSANNRLSGGAGNDTLDGRAGADTMAGGLDNDTFIVDDSGDRVTELANQGLDTVRSAVTFTLAANVENLVLTGAAAINGTGNALDNSITGNAASNTLTGGDGNDVLDGRGGADTMIGGRGNDRYVVDHTGDVVIEQGNRGSDTVLSAITYVLGNHLENLTLTGSAMVNGTGNDLDNAITGNSARNRLVGGRGNDTLDGLGGADAMLGGKGDDIYGVDHTGDAVTEARNEGRDTVRSSITYTLGANVENLTLVGFAVIDGTGNALDNLIVGNSLRNTLRGGAGNDVLDDGGGSPDVLIGGTGNDTYLVFGSADVRESAGEGRDLVMSRTSFVLPAHVENLTLIGAFAVDGIGNGLANVIVGSEFENMLDGRGGGDQMRGGLGNDIYVVDHARDEVIEKANEGIDTVRASVSYELTAHVENLVLTGSAAINGTGNNLANFLIGNAAANVLEGGRGSDTLDGLGGADTLRGGKGDDKYVVDHASDRVIEERNEGTDRVEAGISYTLTDHVENLTLTGSAAINGTGNALDNVLIGNSAVNTLRGGAGNDFIDGGFGMDTMRGGAGNDTYVVTDGDFGSVPTVLSLRGEPGQPLVVQPFDFTPLDGQFQVFLGDITFDGIADSLLLQYSDNTPFGGNFFELRLSTWKLGANLEVAAYPDARSDHFGPAGFAGLDVFGNGQGFVDTAGGFTIHNLVVDYSGFTPVLQSISVDFEQHLFGPASPAVTGRFNYNHGNGAVVPETVIELANEGTDTVRSALDYALPANVENLVLVGNRALRGTGNALANVITGNGLDNFIDGRGGADRMAGAAGNDTFVVDHAGDVVTENAGEGIDTVQSRVTYTLAAHVENLTLTGSAAINGTGNALANVLTGNGGANQLKGLGGDDTYVIGAGDTVVENAGQGNDTIETAMSYTLGANLENLTLLGGLNANGTGNGVANVLIGNSGANRLDGRGGADTMRGLAGDDVYIVNRSADVVIENAGEGTDLVRASVSYALPDHVENLTLTGTGALNGTGNALANVITGNSGNNVLDGGGGVDTMIGGAGNDTYIVDQGESSDAPTVLHLHGEPGAFVVEGTHTLTPENGNFSVSAFDFMPDGLADTLRLAYVDHGGIFVNWFDLEITTRAIPGNLEPGFYPDAQHAAFADPGHPGLALSGNFVGFSTVTGNFMINEAVFDYSSGSPVVVSVSIDFEQHAEGQPQAVFGRFNYNYSGGVLTPESVVELPNEGTDTVRSSIDYTLPDHLENLVLTGTAAIDGTGNGLDNRIIGNAASNRLAGAAGRDTFDYDAMSAADAVTDFMLGTAGDRLDIRDVIDYVGGGSSDIADFVRLAANGSHTDVLVDSDGTGGDFMTLVTLENIAATPGLLNDMLAQGNLIVA